MADVLAKFDDRQITVLRQRFLAENPRTLNELGEQLGVSRERVRQIEAAIKERLNHSFHFGTAVGNLLASIRIEIQPIAALSRLISRHPELARTVPGISVPLWLVLDRLDDYFEVTDGWAAAPDITAAREQTRILLEDFANEHGVVDIKALLDPANLPEPELQEWLRYCGYTIVEDRILTRTRSLGDHAAGLLDIAGQPLHIDDLHQRIGGDRSQRSLANALGGDDRFVRTDRASWGLTGWDVETYAPIRVQIARELNAAGGRIAVDDLVRSITERFDVSAKSIYSYASSGENEIVDGVVQRRQQPAQPRKEPGQTRRLFRHGDVWRFRISVTRDHLRGSGFPVPAGVARLVSCERGDTVELPSNLGVQTIRWTGAQPSSGTIKRFLDSLRVQEGDTAFLEFRPDGTFDVRLMPPLGEGECNVIHRALMLIGSDVAEPSNSTAILAHAVELSPDSKPRRILSTYHQRGDEDIAGLLEQAWTRSQSG
ncbi:sigma factor-like helix-turn-helix DNA-binding protein [Micromonospora sp. LOL_027]|uniref:sigma factor-like helix-turn-helix DNA-binding protein n=1 Tax=Micromonospora sp. LOL_027 TaxID=3345419 RepID=UPI003A88F288